MRIAVWQCRPRPLDVPGNLARLDETAARAAARGAAVLVVPELFLSGYAIGAERVRALAEPQGGPSELAVRAIAAAHGVAIVVGHAELAPDGSGGTGAVHNAATLVDAAGAVRGRHRKAHLWGDLDAAQFTAADAPPRVCDWPDDGARAGLLICYDAEFPEAVRHLAVGGARLLLVPTANPVGFEQVQRVLLPARALESGCAIAYANYCGGDGQLDYNGRSTIIGPDARVLAEAGPDDEALLVADVELGHAAGDDYLRDRRPGLYAG